MASHLFLQTQFNKPSPHLPNYPPSLSIKTPTQQLLCVWHHSAVPAGQGVLQHSSHEIRSEDIDAVSLLCIPQRVVPPTARCLSQVIFKVRKSAELCWQWWSRVFHINLPSGVGRDLVSHPHPHPFIPVGRHYTWHQSLLTAVAKQEGQEPAGANNLPGTTQTHSNVLIRTDLMQALTLTSRLKLREANDLFWFSLNWICGTPLYKVFLFSCSFQNIWVT